MHWETIGFIKASNHRLSILKCMLDQEKTPKELQDSTDIHFSQISLILKELQERGLIKCLNEESRKGKMYSLTQDGKECVDYILKGNAK